MIHDDWNNMVFPLHEGIWEEYELIKYNLSIIPKNFDVTQSYLWTYQNNIIYNIIVI